MAATEAQAKRLGLPRPEGERIVSKSKCDVCGTPNAGQRINATDRQWYPGGRRGNHLAAWISLLCSGCAPGRVVERHRAKPPAVAAHLLPR